MRHRLALLLLLTAVALPALAGVGAQSSSVTTVDPNAPSTEVQQQSSGFVAQNQQMQNAAGANHGIALPGTVNGSATGSPANGEAAENGQPGADGSAAKAAEEHKAPPPPPAPPPTYESRIRPVERAAAPAVPEPGAQSLQLPKAPLAAAAHKTAAAPAATPHPAPAPKPVAPSTPKLQSATSPAHDAPMPTPDPGGGRGEAPDGYTFYFGLLIAGALLALALVTYLRIGRGDAMR